MGDAVENELRGLLVKQGIPPAWQASSERIEAGAVRASAQSKPAAAGEQIARAVYEEEDDLSKPDRAAIRRPKVPTTPLASAPPAQRRLRRRSRLERRV